MKHTIMFMAIVGILLLGCKDKSDVRSFMPGTYVNHSEGEYSIASDTLIVTALENENYSINRRTGFNLIRNGKIGKREFETEKWKAVFDSATGSLIETRRNKKILFFPERKMLMVGSREYVKLTNKN